MLRSVIHGRYLVALLAALLLVQFALAQDVRSVERRDGLSGIFGLSSTDSQTGQSSSSATQASTTQSTAASTTTTSTSDTNTSAANQSSQKSTSGNTSNSQASQTSGNASQTQTSSTQPSNTNTGASAPTTPPPNSQTQPTSDVRSTSYSTGSDGEVSTVIVTLPASALASASSSSSGANTQSAGNSDSGISTGGIVGLSVAGGVALLAVVAFAIFKISRKRYLDEYDDGEAIKWPELGSHGETSHALPTHRTGGAGFETSSEVNLTRPESRAGSIAPSAAASALDLYPTQQDPYAVPPLPHLNPNAGGPMQPYRDDPSAAYYDPYSGSVPQTLEGEAIPMMQIPGRARSPMPGGPGMGMGMGMGMDGRRSPGPAAALAPPMSGMRSPSPGPGIAYGAGHLA